MLACSIWIPGSNTVHWLTATTRRTRLVVVVVSATESIMSSTGADLVQSASSVLVILGKVSTGAIWIPGSNAVHWLTTTTRSTRLVVVGVRATISVVGSAGADLVESASPVLVIQGRVFACSIWIPGSNAVDWLTATTVCALNIVVAVRASISIVCSVFSVLVGSAPAVLVIQGSVFACSIRTPSSHAIHWLRATTSGALLIVMVIRTAKSIVGSTRADLVVSASPVLVILRIMKA